MRPRSASFLLVGLLMLSAPALGGCSDDAAEDGQGIATADQDQDDSSGGGEDSAPDPDTDPGAGGDGAGVVAPIMIDGADTVQVAVGNALDVITPNVTRAETDNPSVLEVSQPSSGGSAEFNAGATVVGEGEATLSVYEGDTKLYDVTVRSEGSAP